MVAMTDAPKPEIQRLQALLETVRLLNSTLELEELTCWASLSTTAIAGPRRISNPHTFWN